MIHGLAEEYRAKRIIIHSNRDIIAPWKRLDGETKYIRRMDTGIEPVSIFVNHR